MKRIELDDLEEKINDMWSLIVIICISLWFPCFYDYLNATLHTPQLLTGLAGDIFVLIYMLFMLSLWGFAMFKVTKLIIKRRKLLG